MLITSDGQGVYRTFDGGLKWEQFNTGLANLRLHASAAGADNNGVSYFVSGTGGGLYRLSPTASAWTQILDASITVTSMAVSPDFFSDQTLLVGDQNGNLLISVDAGSTFSTLTLSIGAGLASEIEFAEDYAVSGEVFIGTTAGLYASSDSLASLTKMPSVGDSWVSALALSPDYRNDATIFLTTPSFGVFKSTDGGLNWNFYDIGVPPVAQNHSHLVLDLLEL